MDDTSLEKFKDECLWGDDDSNLDVLKQLVTKENVALWHHTGPFFDYLMLLNDDHVLDMIDHCVAIGCFKEYCANCVSCAPIHAAILGDCKPPVIRKLLDYGVDVNMKNKYGNRPLDLYLDDNGFHDDADKQTIRMLIDAGGKTDKKRLGPPHPSMVFVAQRDASRSAALIVLGLNRCDCDCWGNGRDVLRVIARCVWSLRGHLDWVRDGTLNVSRGWFGATGATGAIDVIE